MRYLALILVLLAFAVIQVFIGGAKMLYSIPAYSLVAVSGLFLLLPGWRPPKTVSAGCVLSALLWVGYMLVRDRLSPVEYLARPDFLILLGAVMMYLLTAVYFNETKHRAVILVGLIVLAMAHVLVGAIQFKNSDQFMLIPWIKRTDSWWRASGFYISPNHFAGMLEVVGIFAISLVCWSRWKLWAKIFLAYAAAACAFGVAISGSRGGYLSFVAGCAVLVVVSLYVIRKVNPSRFWLGVIAAALVFAMGIGGGVTLMFRSLTLKNRVAQINDPTNMRLYMWAAALKQHALNRVWGTGSGTYLFYGRHFREASVQNDPIYVHNDYLHLLAEYGMAGAACFLIFIGIHGKQAFGALGRLTARTAENRQTQSNALAYCIGAISAVAAYVVHSVVDFNLHIPANALLMGFVFGMIANPGIVLGRRSRVFPAHIARWSVPAAAVGFLVFAPVKLPGEYYAERARMALRDKEFTEAKAFAQKALTTEKNNPDIYYYLGEANRVLALEPGADRQALSHEAIEALENGLKVFPQDIRIVLKLSQAHDALGEFDTGGEYLDQAVDLDPYLASVYAYYGVHYHTQKMLSEAKEQYDHALQLDPTNDMARAGAKEIDDLVNQVKARMRQARMRGEDAPEENDEEPQVQSLPDTSSK